MLTEKGEKILLEKAQQAERVCDWLNVFKFYNQAAELYLTKEMLVEAAKIYKKLGYAKLYSAFTRETADEVVESKNESIKYFDKAEMLFYRLNNNYGQIECKVGILRSKVVLATSYTEFYKDLTESNVLNLIMQLIDYYTTQDDKENLIAVLNYFARFSRNLLMTNPIMEWDNISQKGCDFANQSWEISNEIGNSQFLTESLVVECTLRISQVQIQEFRWDAHWKEIFSDLLSRCNKTLKLIVSKDDYRSLCLAYFINGHMSCFYAFHYIEDLENQKEFTDKGINYLEKSLEIARKINDKYLIIDLISWIDWWALFGGKLDYFQKRIPADIRELEELYKEYNGFRYFSRSLNKILINYYATMARWGVFNSEQRVKFAKKGIEYAEISLKGLSGFKIVGINNFLASLTSLYSQLALLTQDVNKQSVILQKMLDNANRGYEIGQEAKGGFIRSFGCLAKYNAYKTLADLAKKENEKIRFLSIAVEAAKENMIHTVESRTGMITAQLRIGLLLEELGILSQNNDILQEAKENFSKVINEGIERGYKSYAANAYQYVARIDDRLGNYISSAKNYEKSREIHEEALKNIEYKPLIKRIKEKINYSSAWNLIENAKVNQKSENHLKAKEFYNKASEILEEIVRYSYEAPYYRAWAFLEEAEQCSKREQQEKAINMYEKTIEAFKKATKILEKSHKSKAKTELKRIEMLTKVANIRVSYCSARINLENAIIHGRQGEHTTAAELFATAASKFRSVCTRFKLERERKELEAIYFLCRAWESMELAEKYEEHTRFAEASTLFKKASSLFSDTKLKFLSSANSAFCQALENGCKFDESLDPKTKTELYPKVKVMLSKAASLYGKGGFESGADWAQATSMYFDAAWQLIKADEETDLNKKGNLLKIGSEYLRSALDLFDKAGYKEKVREVKDRLYRVGKEEKTLFSALSTIQEPMISRSTLGIIAPTCPVETSESPRLGEIRQFSEEIKKAKKKKKKDKIFKPTLTIEEEPIVLLIMTKGGVPIFSYPFAEEWKFDDELFGGFMSSFSSISDEIFSEGLDRAKFGTYTVLMESASNFLICYLFKGQIYLAKQKLTKFIERIQDSTSIGKRWINSRKQAKWLN